MPVAERPLQRRPRRLSRWSTRTHFLRIPRSDWARVMAGEKREVRTAGQRPWIGVLEPPTPVVAYSPTSGFGGRLLYDLLVCEAAWVEPLGSIGPDSLEREGFETLAEFRSYWRNRHHHGRWNPLLQVGAFTVRPWRGPEDEELFGRLLLERLYLTPVRDGPTDQ